MYSYNSLLPSAFGCFLTGIFYCHLTSWGYFKYRWIIVKLFSTLFFFIGGLLYFSPWINRMVNASPILGQYSAIDPGYNAAIQFHAIMTASQTFLVFLLVVFSVFKPWGKTVRHGFKGLR